MPRPQRKEPTPSFRTDVPPPKVRTPSVPLKILGPRERSTFVVLSQHLVGVNVHWADGRTVPCSGIADKCPECVALRRPVWKGYLHCLEQLMGGRTEPVMLQLTPWACQNCPELLVHLKVLRGATIVAWRTGDRKTGKVWAEFRSPPAPDAQLPQPVDEAAILKKIWDSAPRIGGRTGGVRLYY